MTIPAWLFVVLCILAGIGLVSMVALWWLDKIIPNLRFWQGN